MSSRQPEGNERPEGNEDSLLGQLREGNQQEKRAALDQIVQEHSAEVIRLAGAAAAGGGDPQELAMQTFARLVSSLRASRTAEPLDVRLAALLRQIVQENGSTE
jgi:hypothetical protein